MGIFDMLAGELGGRAALRYTVAGRPLECPHCGNDAFWRSEAALATNGSVLPGPVLGSSVSNILVCSRCTRVEWFLGNDIEAL